MRIFQDTLQRVRADRLVAEFVERQGDTLLLGGEPLDLNHYDRVSILGLGKASSQMAAPMMRLLDDRAPNCLVVTKEGHGDVADGVQIMVGDHPVPSQRSVDSGNAILRFCQNCSANDLVIVLLSGGASALAELPAPGIDIRDIQMITASLLAAGADIYELNAVRSCLSDLKAGGLARACGQATVICLILSDVIGNDRRIIGSGPCWGKPMAGLDALAVLRKYLVPIQEPVEQRLKNLPEVEPALARHYIVGDIHTLLEVAETAAIDAGFKPKAYSRTFQGEARQVGAVMAEEALDLLRFDNPYDCFIAAGESTVRVTGTGTGGRNQEVALTVASLIEGRSDLAILACGTDGTDGPTTAVGGIVDGITAAQTNIRSALENNDSLNALTAANALVETGPTGTNLNDIVIAVAIR